MFKYFGNNWTDRNPTKIIHSYCLTIRIAITLQQRYGRPIRNYGPKSKSTMAAVGNLGIVAPSYRTTHEVFALVHVTIHHVKFYTNAIHNCESIAI